jgi:type I restriction enzyme R subunit
MADGIKESHFESHIVSYLTSSTTYDQTPYEEKFSNDFDRELCLIPDEVIRFIKETQLRKYEALQSQYGQATNTRILQRVADHINRFKTLHVLREKVKDRGQTLDLVYFKPQHNKTPEHIAAYGMNRFCIIRQLRYSSKNNKTLDLTIFLNGLPIATLELKNALTGQYLQQAIRQYIRDRDTKEKIFEFKRCLVHFAVSSEEVSMTTQLKGAQTHFLPFNKELVNEQQNDYAVAYLWKDILQKDSMLDLLQNYINVQNTQEKFYDATTSSLKEIEKTSLIFPRYHQRRAVQRLLEAVALDGVGNKYLIQHSAGSGKSNTISWLAHRLSDLYRRPTDQKALFTSVIVITDRRVLDKQIQDSVRQFEQVPGTVAYIDKNKTSQDLLEAIESGKRIIVTTLQKFPVISDTISRYTNHTYAVLIDEAHSSQTGESARHLRKALSLQEAAKYDSLEPDLDDIIEEEIRKKGNQGNLSYFAFTATPKAKTLELFGTVKDGVKQAFDVYSMEQAIKEGFIKDVLKNYVSWKRYYRIIKRSESEDKEYDKKKAVRLLSSYVDLQDHAIERKTRIMIEHFVSNTQKEIQGKARAMLVTKSRLHAVRYKRKFDEIIREMKLPYGVLVAFSGTVTDSETGEDYTKENMNGLAGAIEIPDALKLPRYRILIVANMYQTGFDEPQLQTMFVDKKLGGASTVQTLSRLNRTMPGKDTTMVLDFVNDPEEVQQDFQLYYGSNFMELEDQSDPNSLYDILASILAYDLIFQTDLNEFAAIFFLNGDQMEKLQPILNRIVSRFHQQLHQQQQADFKAVVKSYVRIYRFLSQMITFTDVSLEKSYVLLSNLYKKLHSVENTRPMELIEDIDLESYKLQHAYTVDLSLSSQNTAMQGLMSSSQNNSLVEETEWLTKIITLLNDTYGLDLKDEDKVEIERMKSSIYTNGDLMGYFNAHNSKDNIQDKFNEEIDNELLNFINTKLELYNKLSEDRVNLMFKNLWFNELYDKKVRGIKP